MYNRVGKKRIITPENVKLIQKNIIKNGGEGLDYKSAKAIVQKYADEKRIQDNKVPSTDGGKAVSRKTVKVYLEEFAQSKSISIKKKVQNKSILRVAAENSLRSVTTFLMTVAATHFIEGKMPENHPAKKKLGTAGARKFYNKIKEAFGNDKEIYPMYSTLLSSTDDTTLFVSPGRIDDKKKRDNEVLVSNEHDNSTQMYYKQSDENLDKNAKGMRVKLTFTFTGGGQMFNPYVTVSGLSERELPQKNCPSGILTVPIPGLCMECNRDPRCEKVGHVIFLCNTVSEESIHLKNHEHYHKEVYRPCVNNIRKTVHGYSASETSKVPEALQSVG